MSTTEANRQIARAAGTVMFAIVLGQLAGLVRGVLVARAFGASPELDAFFAANRVSETLFLLVAGGALGSAFIPAFTGFLAKAETEAAWRLAANVRVTVNDAGTDVTGIDYDGPLAIGYARAIKGAIRWNWHTTDYCPLLECPFLPPGCYSQELRDFKVLDPDGNVFAILGVSTR